jgi:hypothetical protein
MKVADFISQQIQTMPSFYKSRDYEQSKLKVLDNAFFYPTGKVLALTEKMLDGGYVTEEKFTKKKGKRVRALDKPYGTEKFKALPKKYFECDVYQVDSDEKPIDFVVQESATFGLNVYARFWKDPNNHIVPKLKLCFSEYEFAPFHGTKTCKSIANQVHYEKAFLQNDWLKELIFLCQYSLNFYHDPEAVKRSFWFPKEHKVAMKKQVFQDAFDKKGAKGVEELQKLWQYPVTGIIPTDEELYGQQLQIFEKHKTDEIAFLTDFLASKSHVLI